MVIIVALVGAFGLAFCWLQALGALRPRTDFGQPKSKLFFGHIVETYQKDYGRMINEFGEMNESALRNDLCSQILANSHIANEKCVHASRAVKWIAISLLCWSVMFLLVLPIDGPQ